MKKSNILKTVALIGVICLISCNKNVMEETWVQTTNGVLFKFAISQATRTTTSKELKTTFVDRDQIGIWGIKRGVNDVVHSNYKYEYVESMAEWTAERSITFPIDGSNVDFYAYYPYMDIEKANFEFSVAQDQSLEEQYNQSDLLLAVNDKATINDTFITLSFFHSFALVEAEITLPENESVTKIELFAKRTAMVDLVHQTVTVKNTDTFDYITMLKVEDGVFRAVLPAQSVEKGKLLRITATDGNAIYTYWYKVAGTMNFAANRVTTLSVDCTLEI